MTETLLSHGPPRPRSSGVEGLDTGEGFSRPRNWPLAIGSVLVLLIATLAIIGPALAPREPLQTNTVAQVGARWVALPYPPFTVPGFPLGSDTYGRDLLSRLLWGIRPTMILVTLVATVRLAVGLLVGLIAGWSTGTVGRLLEAAIAGALAVPVIIVASGTITAVGIQHGLPAFIIGLALNGWAEPARMVSEQTRSLKSLPFIEAARAMGASGTETLARHILRQIAPMLGMLLAFEAGSTLMVIAALGFLGYYLGGAFWIEVTDFSSRAISGLPELGQMLANSWQIFKPWATVATGTVIFIAVLGLNLVGEGLRRRLSIAELGKHTAFADLAGRVSAWADENFLMPGTRAARQRRLLGTFAVVLILAATAAIWRPWQLTRRPATEGEAIPLALPVVGGHLWATERRDAAGTLASPVGELPSPQVRWILKDPQGFPGGPAVDADGNIYAASNTGILYAVTREGKLRWQVELPAAPAAGPALGPALASSAEPGRLYVTDKAGGLSAFTLDGDFLWRFSTKTGRRASSGAVVGADGTIYYTAVLWVEAVSPGGAPLWTSTRLPGLGESAPRLDPAGNWLYVRDVVVSMSDGSLVDLSSVVKPDQPGIDAMYMVGGDGRRYLRDSHSIFSWQPMASGGECTGEWTWNYRGSVVYLPVDSGITGRGSAWLHYGSKWDDLRLVVLGQDGRLLSNVHYPLRDSQIIATDAVDRIYVCGLNRASGLECVAFAPGNKEPVLRVALDQGSRVNGGALAPGRLYATTADGVLYAIGAK